MVKYLHTKEETENVDKKDSITQVSNMERNQEERRRN